ncbi:MAG: flavin-binding protein dodecin [Psychrobacter glaciei]|jgi:flavin-binding protein dodecin
MDARNIMTIAKNIEISSTSETSFEDAIQQGIERISKTVNNVEGAWIKEQKVGVTDGKISKYHVIMIVSFVINDGTDIS